MDIHAERIQHMEFLVGMLISQTVNHSFCRPKTAAKATDFMPSWPAKPPRSRAPAAQRKQTLAKFDSWIADMKAAGRVVVQERS